jgi:penicillin-binding protein A
MPQSVPKDRSTKSNVIETFNPDTLLTHRLKILIVVIVLLFGSVWVNLYSVQVLRYTEYVTKLDSFTQNFLNLPSQRGFIYDRDGNLLVSNQERLSIVYYPPKNMTNESEWALAYQFVDHFEVSTADLYFRDLQDLYILMSEDSASAKITTEEWQAYRDGELDDVDIYQLKLSRITQSDVAAFDDRTRQAYIVYVLMNKSPQNSIKVIKDNCTLNEIAFLSENNTLFPGFDAQIYYDRSYPNGLLLSTLLGTVTTSKQGLSSESLLYYLALGYSRNSSIGKSGLEVQYESLLKGQDGLYEVLYGNNGLASFTEAQPGSVGQDLHLSFDTDLQINSERIIAQLYDQFKTESIRKYLKNINLVVMNPQNGDVLSMIGLGRDSNGELYNDPTLTYTQSMAIGSTIKGATVYMGLSEGVIRPGEVIDDAPIKISETKLKGSWRYLGKLNDVQAIGLSSNVYMFHIAMRLGGATYQYDKPIDIDIGTFDVMRNYYSQFGLGVQTGLDVPFEATGYKGSATLGGHLLDFAIGQYDTYTVMQLAQYVSTIANDGVRVQPRILLKATAHNTDIVTFENNVKILNTLDNFAALKRVQMGFRYCTESTLCGGLRMLPVTSAAKTGTAETFVLDSKNNLVDSYNTLMIAYAPYDNPEVAIACGIPNAYSIVRSAGNACGEVIREVLNYYFSRNN